MYQRRGRGPMLPSAVPRAGFSIASRVEKIKLFGGAPRLTAPAANLWVIARS